MNSYRNCKNVWVDYKIKQVILNATPYDKLNVMCRLIHLAIENTNNNIVLDRALLSPPGKLTEEITNPTDPGGVIRIMMWNI